MAEERYKQNVGESFGSSANIPLTPKQAGRVYRALISNDDAPETGGWEVTGVIGEEVVTRPYRMATTRMEAETFAETLDGMTNIKGARRLD